MGEHDPLVLSYSHLKEFPREKDAIQTLKKIASLVKPIMRARGWTVRELAEFYPDQANLLGLNVNRGQKILLRLRYPGDRNQFLPIEQVTDTMLHELSHIVHGPHDAKFHALWDQLRDEHEGLVRKGYTGEGFLSDGHRLGGRGQVPMHEARCLARAAAEKRRVLSAGSGQRLGGAAPRPGEDIRRVIVDAIERRNRTLQGCGNTNHNEKEIREISDTASRNGFRTKAEEDAANDAAIAQALWELVQEDEKAKYGSSYIPPSQQNPEGNGGGAVMAAQASGSKPPREAANFQSRNTVSSSALIPPPIPVATRPAAQPAFDKQADEWECAICTLRNPATFLCCDACGTQRSEEQTTQMLKSTKRPRAVIDLTSSPVPKRTGSSGSRGATGNASAPAKPKPATWQCSFCGNHMERQWWTCSACGKMKDDSK
ncbi:putative zinc metallopeptidase [Coniochaeta sp. PMI_546]|nr:putative zinc metallopeptidase [Coniochaeta sp. PMI_546]